MRERLPTDRQGVTHRFKINTLRDGEPVSIKGYVTTNVYTDGRVGEIFAKLDKMGSEVSGLIDAWSILASMLLQHGVPLANVIAKFKGTRFEPSGRTETPGLRYASSPLDYIARYLEKRFILKEPFSDDPGPTIEDHAQPFEDRPQDAAIRPRPDDLAPGTGQARAQNVLRPTGDAAVAALGSSGRGSMWYCSKCAHETDVSLSRCYFCGVDRPPGCTVQFVYNTEGKAPDPCPKCGTARVWERDLTTDAVTICCLACAWAGTPADAALTAQGYDPRIAVVPLQERSLTQPREKCTVSGNPRSRSTSRAEAQVQRGEGSVHREAGRQSTRRKK